MKWKVLKEGKRWESHEFEGEKLHISIHRHISHDPDEWILSCHDVFGSRQISLGKVDIEIAKSESVARVKVRLQSMMDDLD